MSASAEVRTDQKAGWCSMCRGGSHALCASATCVCPGKAHRNRPSAKESAVPAPAPRRVEAPHSPVAVPSVVRWEDPPEVTRGRRVTFAPELLRELRANRGRWARVDDFKAKSGARSRLRSFEKGNYAPGGPPPRGKRLHGPRPLNQETTRAVIGATSTQGAGVGHGGHEGLRPAALIVVSVLFLICIVVGDHEITVLKSERYVDIWDVFDRTGYLVGPNGAKCTGELKKRVRHAFERPTDLHVWGYTADRRDIKRAQRFVVQNPGVSSSFPLIERSLTKADCLALVERAGIRLPAMYELGYSNNNCLGCVKGGMGYWNKLRVDFPDVFAKMAAQERKMGRTVLRSNNEPLYLDELDADRGDYHGETPADCSLDCQTVEAEYDGYVPVVLGRAS